MGIQINYFSKTVVPAVVMAMLAFVSTPASAAPISAESHVNECVVLVHGLARTSHSMDDMGQALQAAGYRTVNIDYPSRSQKIQDLALMVGRQAIDGCRAQAGSTIHFVTHSMGGIVVRYYLAKNDIEGLGRVVMLAPPNRGSLLTDQLRDELWYKWLTGPAGQQLGTGEDGVPGMLGAVDYETGVIAGNVHSPVDNWLAEKIPGADDGKVAVDHAKVDGMQDFLVLPYTHISIMNEGEVIQQSLHFLQHGRFDHGTARQAQQSRPGVGKGRAYFD